VLDILCQKLAHQAVFIKDLVSVVAMEDCTPHIEDDETTSTSSFPSSTSYDDASSSIDETRRNYSTEDMSVDGLQQHQRQGDFFPIMQLPVEVYKKQRMVEVDISWNGELNN
jgi:hypothetical protein